MARKLWLMALIFIIVAALAPAAVLAQDDGQADDGLLLRINGPVTVGSQETLENVIVIGDNATIDGAITGSLVVINGDAIVSGHVDQDVTVVRGTLTLAPTAQVGNVAVFRGTLVQEAGSTVAGTIAEGDFRVNLWDWGVFSAFFWLGMTFTILVAGLMFAAIGGRQLKAAGDAMVNNVGSSLLGVVAAWIVLPITMILVLFTLVGIPLGIGYFLFVLPAVWFLGYLVAGTQIGRLMMRGPSNAEHPYLAALVGLLVLQIVGIIPVLGGLIAFVAGVIGSGALLVLAWRAWRGPSAEPKSVVQPVQVSAPSHGD